MKAKEELQRAVAVLKHIKKKAGPGIYDVEYQAILEEVLILHRDDHAPPEKDPEDKEPEPKPLDPPPKQPSPQNKKVKIEEPKKLPEKPPLIASQEYEIAELTKKL